MVPIVGKLILLVAHIIPDTTKTASEPIYFNDSALEFPDTALEAVRKEADHLYDNAFAICPWAEPALPRYTFRAGYGNNCKYRQKSQYL